MKKIKKSTKIQNTLTLKETSINITLPCTLFEYSETLTFDQIQDTLFAIDLFINSEDHSMFSKEDLVLLEQWMKRNDVTKFLQARELAIIAHNKILESEIFAREISNMPLRFPRSH